MTTTTRRLAPVAAPPAADPLADLRLDVPDVHPATVESILDHAAQTPVVDYTLATIRAWHADSVATNIVHRGGVCGCRYLAEIAMAAAGRA